jgi:hypothetical protein
LGRCAALTFGDGSDQLVLAHPSGAGDAERSGERLQLRQHHSGQAGAGRASAAGDRSHAWCFGAVDGRGDARCGIRGVGRGSHLEDLGGVAQVGILP